MTTNIFRYDSSFNLQTKDKVLKLIYNEVIMVKKKFQLQIKQHKDKYLKIVNKDKWRAKYHLMAPIGWINDPNGLCHFKGLYHVYYQYSPLDANGGLKFWGHYTSENLVKWKEEEIALYPDEEFDKDGVYSGSALVKDDELYFFYTGNVTEEGEHDYILTGRQQNVILVKSTDGINFSDKKVLLTNKDFPGNMSLHVRDPKVWEEDGRYYMVLGARSKEHLGYVLLYQSDDLYNWQLHSEPVGGELEMGYMWECPDMFKLNEKEIFLFSPQGIEAKGHNYNNIYQSGYTIGEINGEKKISLDVFTEIDRGFDFYAPQTFLDIRGRRIMIGWMGVPDAIDHENPTINNFWQHQLTIPRELTIEGEKIYQRPIEELQLLRKDNRVIEDISIEEGVTLELFDRNTFELEINTSESESFQITFREDCKLIFKDEVFILALGKSGHGRDGRSVEIEKVDNINIFSDSSSLEIFLNNGEEVFSTRIYNEGVDSSLKVKGCGSISLNLWNI